MANFRRRLMMQSNGGNYLTNKDPSKSITLDIFNILSPISQYSSISLEFMWMSEDYYSLYPETNSPSKGINIIDIQGNSYRYFRIIGYIPESNTIPTLGFNAFGTTGMCYPIMREGSFNWGARAYCKITSSNSLSRINVFYYNNRGELTYYMTTLSSTYYSNYGTTIISGAVKFVGDIKIGQLTLGNSVLIPAKKNGLCGFIEESSGLFVGSEGLILTN